MRSDDDRALTESLPQIVTPPGLSIPAGLVRSPWAVAFPATSSFTADLEVIVTQALLSADWTATSSFTADLQVISPVNLAATFAGTSSFTADLEAIA